MTGIDFLADTNFLIHIHEGNPIVEPLLDYKFAVSYITEIELLGKFSISKTEKPLLKSLLDDCFIFEMDSHIKSRTIWIRQHYKIKIPDAIIAATAIEIGIPLISSDNDYSTIKN
jgi:predicted nucleic acid-binding protein